METIKIKLTYEWEVNSKEWDDFLTHSARLKTNPQIAFNEDPVSYFYYMNNLKNPILADFNITKNIEPAN